MENQEITKDEDVRVTILVPKSRLIKTRSNAKKRGLNVSSYLRQLAIDDDERINSKTLKKEIAN